MTRPALPRALALAGVGLALPLVKELRVGPAHRRITSRWQSIPIPSRRGTQLGLSFRPRQCEDLDLDPKATLATLLDYPYEVIRLAAYWDRVEPSPGVRDHDELDWQLEAAERAGKKVILNLGAVKSFGYPEYFVPDHHLDAPLPEGELITPGSHPRLLDAASSHLADLVAKYADRPAIVAWQVEHDAVDPLGMEHSWRLSTDFVQREIAAVREVDSTRPIMLNGFLPMSTVVAVSQWWRTRDQGDSVKVAEQFGDIIGIDSYPRHAAGSSGAWTLYLDGAAGWLPRRRRRRMLRRIAESGGRVVVTEGQAEPWEAVTVPPDPIGRCAASCPPEQVISNYARWQDWTRQAWTTLDTYLFWGAEYWVLRSQGGDDSYLDAFARVLAEPDDSCICR